MAKAGCCSDLLQSPEGPGFAFVRKELGLKESVSHGLPPKTFRVDKSSVVSRARHLLPLLATADRELQQRLSSEPPNVMDIENVAEDEPHIEMDLAVVPLGSQQEEGETSSSDSSSGSSSESEEEEGEPKTKTFPLRLPQNTRPKRRCVNIEELSYTCR